LSADQTKVPGAIEAEDTPQIEVSEAKTSVQEMTGFPSDRWSGGKQLFCSEGKPGSQIRITFNVEKAGLYDLRSAMTMAPDFAVVRVLVDGTATKQEIDLYNAPDVISTGPLTLSQQQFTAGPHVVTVEITGKNPSSKGMLIGIDYLQLIPASQP
jgi:hypothetical protein